MLLTFFVIFLIFWFLALAISGIGSLIHAFVTLRNDAKSSTPAGVRQALRSHALKLEA